MMEKTKYDYGKCDVCGARMREMLIKQDLWIRGKLIVVEDVPAGVCPRCGEKVVKSDIGRRIIKIIENSERIAKSRKISVPAINFGEEEAVA